MYDLFAKKKKRMPVGLQLAPLVDIFMLIIIFLIKSTVISGSSVSPPPDLKPAFSQSPEGVEPVEQLYLTNLEIHFQMIGEKILVSDFISQIEASRENKNSDFTGNLLVIQQKLSGHVDQMLVKDQRSGVSLNFLADASVDYKTTYEVAKFCRESGFQNVFFVAEGEK